jgi:hypothetical protein
MTHYGRHLRQCGVLVSAVLAVLMCIHARAAEPPYVPRAGDLIFQVSGSAQAEAVRLVTGATYGHVGVVFMVDGVPKVLEAGGDVHYTSVDGFIRRSQGGKYVVKRLQDAAVRLDAEHIRQMQRLGESWRGRDYDKVFSWNDGQMYCTELVWKIYQRVLGVELGRLQQLREFNLGHPGVQVILRERYGGNIPLEEKVISPAELFRAPVLVTVFEGGR